MDHIIIQISAPLQRRYCRAQANSPAASHWLHRVYPSVRPSVCLSRRQAVLLLSAGAYTADINR